MQNPRSPSATEATSPASASQRKEQRRDEMIGQTVGSYRVVKLLGQGGMGAVYLGEHPAIGSKVAIKVLHPQYAADAKIVDRFFNEARAVNLIGHDNIVSILDFNVTQDDRHYFVMEFLHGRPLQALLDGGEPMPFWRAGPILLQCCKALQAAHERGIVHRDLKPDNVFLVDRGDRTDFVKLVDFGIAKLTDPSSGVSSGKTQTGMVMGTPAYMSPEQAAGESTLDARSDVYSLGATLFHMVTGTVPFAGAGPSFGKILLAHLQTPPPPPSSINPEIPAELEEIILRTLEKDPAARYQTMNELHDALLGCMERLGLGSELPMAGQTAPPSAPGKQGETSRPRQTLPSATPALGSTAVRAPRAASAPKRRIPVAAIAAGAIGLAAAAAAAVFFWPDKSREPAPPPRKSAPPPTQEASAPPPQPAEASPIPPPAPDSTPPAGSSAEASDARTPRAGGAGTRTPPAPETRSTRPPPQRKVVAAAKQEVAPAAAAAGPPSVFFQCAGAQDVCSALRTAVDEALDRAGMPSVRNPGRADATVSARVAGVDGAATQQFGTTFTVRTYSIELSAEAVRTSEAISMPAATTVSYDPTYGRERVAEKSRLVASDLIDKLQAFAKKR